jgi:hypothetical protein
MSIRSSNGRAVISGVLLACGWLLVGALVFQGNKAAIIAVYIVVAGGTAFGGWRVQHSPHMQLAYAALFCGGSLALSVLTFIHYAAALSPVARVVWTLIGLAALSSLVWVARRYRSG